MSEANATPSGAEPRRVAVDFFYDLGSSYAWLTAERIDALFTTPPVWTPVLLGELFWGDDRLDEAAASVREQ